ncbi:MFS transporter [Nocardioides sp. C4-1]|uniref:MFS transporter n=1 Tax=Nocardioides sp. C4-1 TaxID=3151851 RepID=UPI00326782C7
MRRPLYGWLTAEGFSLTGTRVSMLALPLFALAETGSATMTGLVALAETLPMVVAKVLAGPVVDRVGPRRVAITGDLLSLVVVASIPLLHDLGHLPFWGFLALVALAGTLRGPADGAKQAMVPALVREAGVPLERATGLSGTVERTASMLGAGLGGGLVAAVGGQDALLVTASTFGVSAAVLAWATASLGRPEPNADSVDDDPGRYVDDLREGWRFLRGDRLLLGITVMVSLTNLLDAAWSSVLLPVWSVESGEGAATLGVLLAVFSGSSALGAVCAAVWAARLPRFKVYLVAFLVAGLPRFLAFALDSPLVVLFATFVLTGFACGFINPVLGAVIFERIPERLVGRVSSLTTAMCWSMVPLGGLLGGVLVDAGGLSFALLVAGLAYLAVTVAPALDPRWRELDRRPEPAEVTTAA